jgi:hypothetical protein
MAYIGNLERRIKKEKKKKRKKKKLRRSKGVNRKQDCKGWSL